VSVVGLKVTQIVQGILGRVNRSKQFELCCVSEDGNHALIDHSMRVHPVKTTFRKEKLKLTFRNTVPTQTYR
jgi:hypothetical protein